MAYGNMLDNIFKIFNFLDGSVLFGNWGTACHEVHVNLPMTQHA
jgi:hypothetical protein